MEATFSVDPPIRGKIPRTRPQAPFDDLWGLESGLPETVGVIGDDAVNCKAAAVVEFG